jgi:hypothetical protein
VRRPVRLLLGLALLGAGVLVGLFGSFWLLYGGDEGSDNVTIRIGDDDYSLDLSSTSENPASCRSRRRSDLGHGNLVQRLAEQLPLILVEPGDRLAQQPPRPPSVGSSRGELGSLGSWRRRARFCS